MDCAISLLMPIPTLSISLPTVKMQGSVKSMGNLSVLLDNPVSLCVVCIITCTMLSTCNAALIFLSNVQSSLSDNIQHSVGFGLSQFGVGVSDSLPTDVTFAISYWLNILMTCAPGSTEESCVTKNGTSLYEDYVSCE